MATKLKLMTEGGKKGRGLVPAPECGELDVPYQTFLESLDPRGKSERTRELHYALAESGDMRFLGFLRYLFDPSEARLPLATIAKKSDITLHQFREFWSSSRQKIARARVMESLPAVVSDMTEDARSQKVNCTRCDGYGYVFVEAHRLEPGESSELENKQMRVCPDCQGEGVRREVGNLHARDRILEIGGMISRHSGGATVQIMQNFGGASIESAVGAMNKVSFAVDADEGPDAAGTVDVVDVKALPAAPDSL